MCTIVINQDSINETFYIDQYGNKLFVRIDYVDYSFEMGYARLITS